MIGDAKARGKVHSTTKAGPEFKKKNSQGHSFKTIDTHKDMSDDSGDAGTHAVARRMTKGMKPGTGLPNGPGPTPYEAKMGSGRTSGHKLIPSKDESRDSGAAIDAWCCGKRSTYK